jgi:rhodanese-related sulfurtransferase
VDQYSLFLHFLKPTSIKLCKSDEKCILFNPFTVYRVKKEEIHMYSSVKKTNVQISKDIFPAEAWELILKNREDNDLSIIDVSTPQEYKDLHLEGAINVNLLSRFFKTRLDVMDKSRTYVVYCKVGGRSKIAQKLMHQLGFQAIFNITGGTLLWEEEGLPFASGTKGVNKFSFCPFFISIVTFKKIKKILHNVSSRITQNTGIVASSGQES